MDARALLTDGFGRIRDLYVAVADGLDDDALNHRPDGTGNPIGWLLWHLARVQDDHLAGLTGDGQVWPAWSGRFGLPVEDSDIGYGHSSAQVASVQIGDAGLLAGYHAEVHQRTLEYLARVDADELDRVVDRRWNPPVTAGVRLVSMEGDCLQHLGQAAYVKGLLGR
jgi:hypothetical protein